MPSSAVFSSFKNFPISVDRTLLPCNSAIVIAVIVDFAYCEFSEGIRSVIVISLALAFAALLMISLLASVFMLMLQYYLLFLALRLCRRFHVD